MRPTPSPEIIDVQPQQKLDDWSQVGAPLPNESARFKCAWTNWLQPLVCSRAASRHVSVERCPAAPRLAAGSLTGAREESPPNLNTNPHSGEKKGRNREMREERAGLVSLSALPSGRSPW